MENLIKLLSKLQMKITRKSFLKSMGALTGFAFFGPLFSRKFSTAKAAPSDNQVFLVKNGDCFQNTAKIWEMLGGAAKYIGANDVVVIKANGQWPNQGYTHTGVIKGVIDKILEIPNFTGEVIICDNVQNYGSTGRFGFDATTSYRQNNWADHNWNSLATYYQNLGKKVSTKRWMNTETDISGPADGEGWIRSFFDFHGSLSYLSYPIFASPLNPSKLIDMKNGVWEAGKYNGQKVFKIFIPGLNNHGNGGDDYAGITSAIKCFFGATEIHYGGGSTFRGHRNIHASSYSRGEAAWAGELAARYINTMYTPDLYITAAMWSGHNNRTGPAVETKTVLACTNPVTLDYVACRDIISKYSSWLNPDSDNSTRKQILGCISGGVGTITPTDFEVITYDFLSAPSQTPKSPVDLKQV